MYEHLTEHLWHTRRLYCEMKCHQADETAWADLAEIAFRVGKARRLPPNELNYFLLPHCAKCLLYTQISWQSLRGVDSAGRVLIPYRAIEHLLVLKEGSGERGF